MGQGRVVNSPDAGMAREVDDVGSWVILHERTGAVQGAEPVPQWCEKALSKTAEDLGEDRVPGSPVSSRGVFNWPEEGAGRLWGELGIQGRVQTVTSPHRNVSKGKAMHVEAAVVEGLQGGWGIGS